MTDKQQNDPVGEALERLYKSELYGDYDTREYSPNVVKVKQAIAIHEQERALIAAAVRAIGDHNAPNDCYATGPMTGDPIKDLVECPACAFLNLYSAMIAGKK